MKTANIGIRERSLVLDSLIVNGLLTLQGGTTQLLNAMEFHNKSSIFKSLSLKSFHKPFLSYFLLYFYTRKIEVHFMKIILHFANMQIVNRYVQKIQQTLLNQFYSENRPFNWSFTAHTWHYSVRMHSIHFAILTICASCWGILTFYIK